MEGVSILTVTGGYGKIGLWNGSVCVGESLLTRGGTNENYDPPT